MFFCPSSCTRYAFQSILVSLILPRRPPVIETSCHAKPEQWSDTSWQCLHSRLSLPRLTEEALLELISQQHSMPASKYDVTCLWASLMWTLQNCQRSCLCLCTGCHGHLQDQDQLDMPFVVKGTLHTVAPAIQNLMARTLLQGQYLSLSLSRARLVSSSHIHSLS